MNRLLEKTYNGCFIGPKVNGSNSAAGHYEWCDGENALVAGGQGRESCSEPEKPVCVCMSQERPEEMKRKKQSKVARVVGPVPYAMSTGFGWRHAPDPIPAEMLLLVPAAFSLVCDCICGAECYDYIGPHSSREQAKAEGWTNIRFTPFDMGQNYGGLCPKCTILEAANA